MGKIQISKIDAALRQLKQGINLLFSDGDPVVTHTLIGAASSLMSDLINHQAPDKSWDKEAADANQLLPADYFRIMRQAQNFFKHASTDPKAILDFDLSDTESLAFSTVMNASEVVKRLPLEAQIFQLWYLASNYPAELKNESPFKESIDFFGDLKQMHRKNRLKIGLLRLNDNQFSELADD